MNRRWICNDIWMDMFPFFDRPQLGLKLALLSPRFNALVDKHFDAKIELPIWNDIKIYKDRVAEVPKLHVFIDYPNSVEFPLPDRPLPDKIRFTRLWIDYIDHFVLAFLRANKQIFDKDTALLLNVWKNNDNDIVQLIWNVLVHEIWPFFAPNICHLDFPDGDDLDNLRRRTSPKILSDLNQLNSINFDYLLPDSIGDFDDEPNSTTGQMLSKWLHTPGKDGQSKRLFFMENKQRDFEWVNTFKEKFLRATTSVSYEILFPVHEAPPSIVPFELVNDRTQEKLTMQSENVMIFQWMMKRCPIGETATVHWGDKNRDDLNIVHIWLNDAHRSCIGPLTPPSAAAEEEAGESSEKGA